MKAGPTEKTQHRRDTAVAAMAAFLLETGLASATLRPLAAAAALSDRMLIYHFGSKEAAIEAALGRVAASLAVILAGDAAAGPVPFARLESELIALSRSPALAPFMALWLELAALAARGDPLYRAIGADLARGFIAWIAARLDAAPEDREPLARLILRAVEGEVVLGTLGV